MWESGTGRHPRVSATAGHSAEAEGAAGAEKALEMKAAVFGFPKCLCVPQGLQLPLPCWFFFFFFFPVPLSDILRGKLPALTGGLLFSFSLSGL